LVRGGFEVWALCFIREDVPGGPEEGRLSAAMFSQVKNQVGVNVPGRLRIGGDYQ
jgi:hypothetical protein